MKPRSKSGNNQDLQQSTEDAAAELDIKVGRLHNLYAMGAPHTKQSRPGQPVKTSAAAVMAWASEAGVDIHASAGRPPLHEDSPDLEAARLRKENALAAKYELQVAKERTELVPVEEVKRNLVRLGAAFRSRSMGIISTLAIKTEGQDGAERHQTISNGIHELLGQLAEDIRRLGGSGDASARATA
jgi:phage terminase Nu1 subunit (DNA packaging protein)